MKKTANLEIQAKEATGRYEAFKAHYGRWRADRLVPAQDAFTFFADQGINKVDRASRIERRF